MSKKLNLGCGYDKRDGYINIDLQPKHDPDICADVTSLPMLESGAYEEIVAQDILEHLERHKVIPALQEWSRLLAPEGMLHLRIPSLLHMFKMLSLPHNRAPEEAEKVIHLMYGTQDYTGDYHLSGFTAELINAYLERCGLKITNACILGGWLFELHARKTEHLKQPEEIIHNVCFKTLGRPANEHDLHRYTDRIAQGDLTYSDIERELLQSKEGKFISIHPKYLWDHTPLSRLRYILHRLGFSRILRHIP